MKMYAKYQIKRACYIRYKTIQYSTSHAVRRTNGVRTFRRQTFRRQTIDRQTFRQQGTFRRQPLNLCVVVICRFNTVLRVQVILSAGDVDCSFPASFAFPLWFLGIWFNGQFIHRLLCCAVLHWMTVTRKQACLRLTGHQQNDVIRFRGSE